MRQVLYGSLLILASCIAISPSLAEEPRPAGADLVIVRPPPLHSYAREEHIVQIKIANIGTVRPTQSSLSSPATACTRCSPARNHK